MPNMMYVPFFISVLVIRQLNSSIAITSLTSGQCRLAPLIQVIQDSSHLYHFTVKLLFKLHACKIYIILKKKLFSMPWLISYFWSYCVITKSAAWCISGLPADTLQGHRERFHEQFRRCVIQSQTVKECYCSVTARSKDVFTKWCYITAALNNADHFPHLPAYVPAAALYSCSHSFTDYIFVLKCLLWRWNSPVLNCETDFGRGYEIIITVLFSTASRLFSIKPEICCTSRDWSRSPNYLM